MKCFNCPYACVIAWIVFLFLGSHSWSSIIGFTASFVIRGFVAAWLSLKLSMRLHMAAVSEIEEMKRIIKCFNSPCVCMFLRIHIWSAIIRFTVCLFVCLLLHVGLLIAAWLSLELSVRVTRLPCLELKELKKVYEVLQLPFCLCHCVSIGFLGARAGLPLLGLQFVLSLLGLLLLGCL